ncbi:MAG TPA: MATE family efflux transporter [Acidimicrobiales bacterium]|nr:MATE family efflux transporter [Acidimicrobiales bacterium]
MSDPAPPTGPTGTGPAVGGRPGRRALDREIARLAVPAFATLVAEPLYVLADTAVVGHLGTEQLAGLALASTVLLTGHAVFIFLAYGTTAAVARLLGAGDERRAAHQAVQGLWLAVAIGVALTALGWWQGDDLIRVLGGEGDVATQAGIYLRISLLGVPALLLTLAGTGYLRGLQDTRTPLVVAVVSALANLVIELVLIFGLGFGIGASALSTVIAQVGAAAVFATIVARAAARLGVGARPDLRAIAALAKVGGDLLVRTAALRFSLTVATAVTARLGTVPLAAHQIAFEIWSVLALGLDAIAIAGQAMIGRLLGAGDAAGARVAGRRMITWGVVAGVGSGLVVLAASPWLPRVFSPDPEVVALAGFLLVWVAALQPVNGVVFVLDGVLIGAGDLRFLAVAMVGAAAVFVPAVVAVGVLGLGVGWVWASLGLLMLTRLVVLGARFAGDRWAVVGAVRA